MDYMQSLASNGHYHFTANEAQATLAVSCKALNMAISHMHEKGLVVSPARNFYLIIPPEYIKSGCLPPRWDQKERSAKLMYRFQSEDQPAKPLRLKIEINTIEPFSVCGFKLQDYSVDSEWFKGEASVCTYELEELMATKLRALYQRLKGRDLLDLWFGIIQLNMDCQKVIDIFIHYNQHHGIQITLAQLEENLYLKLKDKTFVSDIDVLLPMDITCDLQAVYELVLNNLIRLVPGDPWKTESGKNKK